MISWFYILENKVDNFIKKDNFIYYITYDFVIKESYNLDITIIFLISIRFNKYTIIYI